ncbi:MAG: shikimate dehydrogenase, partial [Gammaproteobacteria bacterium]|nr:shikimate dehydrogenase [Gammaproteobacteria bacterium]
ARALVDDLVDELAEEPRAERSDVAISGCGLDEIAGSYDLVINGTSAGLAGEGALAAPAAVRGAFCYDLLYSPEPGARTPFCAWAIGAGAAKASDGLGMLVEQAAAAFAIWRGTRPDTATVLAELRMGR